MERSTGSGTAAYTTNYSYNDSSGGGWLSRQTTSDAVSTSYAYDTAGEKTSVTDGASDTTAYAYDGLGRQVKLTYPDGTVKATGYDGAGNPVSVQQLNASGTTLSTTTAAFDGEGHQVSSTDAAGNSSTFTFDPTGVVTQELQPVSASSGVTISFGYDAAGHQTRYTDGNGNPWWDTYNSWGLQESRVEPYTSAYSTSATSTFTTAYDADKNPATETEPGGVTITDTYNNLDELTGQSATGADAASPTRTFGYDTNGRMTSAATSNTLGTGSNATSESFTYNDRGLVLTASGSAGSSSYGYNGDGLVSSVTDAAGTTSYTYDNAGRLATLADPATGTTGTYSYNPDSQVTGISYGTGQDTRSFGYDTRHRLTSTALKSSAGATIASVGYGYNADSEITSQTTTGLAGPASSTYTYDQAGRITSWNNGTTTTAYGYDANGNLTQDGSKTYTYDARDEKTADGTNSYTYTARGTPSTETGSSGPLAVTFDAYGDQATAGTRFYGYDALGRLTSDTAASGTQYAFSYAGSTGTIASDGTSTYTWDPSGSVLAGTGVAGGTASQGVLALGNSHGDLVGQFAAADTAVAASQAYDPWGAVTTSTGVTSGLLGYQSAWADPASGKSLMGARWYDPTAGDFTSADSVQVSPDPDPAAGDPFAYAADNPLDLTDPTGHAALDAHQLHLAHLAHLAAVANAAAASAHAAHVAHVEHLAHLAYVAQAPRAAYSAQAGNQVYDAHTAHVAHVDHLAHLAYVAQAAQSGYSGGSGYSSPAASLSLDAHQLHLAHLAHLAAVNQPATQAPAPPYAGSRWSGNELTTLPADTPVKSSSKGVSTSSSPPSASRPTPIAPPSRGIPNPFSGIGSIGTFLGGGAALLSGGIASTVEGGFGAVAGGTTDLFRAVGVREFETVLGSGKFLPGANSMSARQFAFTLEEALAYANWDLSKVAILKATVQSDVLQAFDFSRNIDVSIFKNGVITVQPGEQTDIFHSALTAIEHVL